MSGNNLVHDLIDFADRVETLNDLLDLIHLMSIDAARKPNDWAHGSSLSNFLEACEACVRDNSKSASSIFSEEASWNAFAQILVSGTIYE